MGRWSYTSKQEADSLRKIKIWFLKKEGFIGNHIWKSGTMSWTNEWANTVNRINIASQFQENECFLQLSYVQTDPMNGEKKHFDYKVPLISTTCFFGGRRYWFKCPLIANGVYCGKRVGVLYKAGDHFGCRHCYNLTYECQNENRRWNKYISFSVMSKYWEAREGESKLKRKFYRGKPTRKYKAVFKLQQFILRNASSINNL